MSLLDRLPLDRLSSSGRSAGENPLAGPLGRRLLGWFLVFSLVPLLLSNMVGYLESEQIIEGLVRRQLGAIAEAEAQHVRDQLSRSLADLRALAVGNEFLAAGAANLGGRGGRPDGQMVDVADREAIGEYLQRKHGELSEFDALILQGSDGALLAFSGPGDPSLYRSASRAIPPPSFQAIGPATSDGRSRFRLTAPVTELDGDPSAYLAGVIGPSGMEHFLEIPEHLAGSIESFVVDEMGRPLFVSHVHGELDFGAPLSTPLLSQESRTFAQYTDREGSDVIGTSVPIGDLSWRYVAEFPVKDALGPLVRLRRISLLMAVLFAAVLLVSAWLVTGGIVAPVRELVSATRRVGSGEFDVRVEAEERDEIGELARAFNEMTGRLKTAAARVEELHKREIERANQLATVGELASGVAHEIKNPVVGIANGLDLVKREVSQHEKLAPIIEEMSRQLERIESAIRDLLAFARPGEPNIASVEAREVVERAVRLVQPAAERAGVEVRTDVGSEGAVLRADEELLRQALVNLLMNAVQATPAGGRVCLPLRLRGDHVRFRVVDTGKGIHAEDLDDVFKPFFTTRHSGTGLGLPITREIVERHGGSISVESSLGEGTTFTVDLPLRPPASDSEGPGGHAGGDDVPADGRRRDDRGAAPAAGRWDERREPS